MTHNDSQGPRKAQKIHPSQKMGGWLEINGNGNVPSSKVNKR